jgi:hypothetical protein
MLRHINRFFIAVALCVFASAASQCYAGTIIKLSLGGDAAADVEYTGGLAGVLSTVDDLNAATTGDQNTAVEFLDILDPVETDILTSTASFTLDGVVNTGPAIVIGGSFLVQNFTGGTLELYDASNVLLLSGTLDVSSLTGTLGPPATGGLITATFGAFTGGALSPYLDPDSLALSIALADINGAAGLSVAPPPPFPPPLIYDAGLLTAFTADAAVIIAADPVVPEPVTIAMLVVSSMWAAAATRRRQCAV